MCLISPPVSNKRIFRLRCLCERRRVLVHFSMACSPFVTSSSHVTLVNISFSSIVPVSPLIYTYLHYLLREENDDDDVFITRKAAILRFGRPQNQKRHQHDEIVFSFFFITCSQIIISRRTFSNLTSSRFTGGASIASESIIRLWYRLVCSHANYVCEEECFFWRIKSAREKTWLDFSINNKPCAEVIWAKLK